MESVVIEMCERRDNETLLKKPVLSKGAYVSMGN